MAMSEYCKRVIGRTRSIYSLLNFRKRRRSIPCHQMIVLRPFHELETMLFLTLSDKSCSFLYLTTKEPRLT